MDGTKLAAGSLLTGRQDSERTYSPTGRTEPSAAKAKWAFRGTEGRKRFVGMNDGLYSAKRRMYY